MSDQSTIYSNLEELFQKSDPWVKTKEYRKEAEENILTLLRSVPHASVLEVGCAEGAFTKRLLTVAKNVTGIDVSKTAIEKARKNVPGAQFAVASFEDFDSDKKFDVIICSEILYYIIDHNKATNKLNELGKYLITSHFITYFPQVCFGSLKYEFYLRKFPVIKTIWEKDLRLGLLVIKRLRKLS